MRLLRLLTLLLAPLPLMAQFSVVPCTHGETGTCRQATTCNQSDVQAAVNASSAGTTGYVSPTSFGGDGVYVPSGSCSWASAVSWSNKNINLIGNNPTITHSSDFLDPSVTNSGTTAGAFRVSGFTLVGGAGAHVMVMNGGAPPNSGYAGFYRIDHITYTESGGSDSFVWYGPVFGVMDHLNGTVSNKNHFLWALFYNGEYPGSPTLLMGQGIATGFPAGLGGQLFNFIEDSTFACTSGYGSAALTDSSSGVQRMVFRHNTVTGSCFHYAHWTRSGEWDGGVMEFYNNNYNCTASDCVSSGGYPGRFGAGTGVIHDNTINGYGLQAFNVDESRGCGAETSGFAGAVVNSNFDRNDGDASAIGWPAAGQIGTACIAGSCTPATMNSVPFIAWNNGTQSGCSTGGSCTNTVGFNVDGNQGTGSCSRPMGNYIKSTAHASSGGLNGAIDIFSGPTKPSSVGIYTGIASYSPYPYPYPTTTGGGTTFTLATSTTGAGSGTVTCTPPAPATLASGTTVSCSASASSGSTLTSLTGTGSASACSGTGTCGPFSIAANTVVTANFAITTFTWTKNIVGSGTVTGTNNTSGSYSTGTTIGPLTANPGAGSNFSGWSAVSGSAACSGTTNPCPSFSLTANSAATATFTPINYTLSTTPLGTGSGTITGCAGTYHFGDAFSCNLNPAAGSSLTSASGCGGTLSGSVFSGTMPAASCTVGAVFTLNSFSFTLNLAGTGSGTIGTVGGAVCSTGSYPSGQTITCTQSPAAGSTFAGWSGACSGTGSCSFSLTSSQSVTATFQGTVAAPVATPGAGSYGPAQSVALASSTPGATIYYTTDGSTPTHLSTVYSSPIAVSVNTTIKAIAAAPSFTDSPILTAAYVINGAVADPVLSPAPGAYGTSQSVTITDATSGSTIRYTTNGSQPTCSTGTLYSSPVTVASSLMLAAVGCKAGFSDSNPVGGTYLINGAAPPPVMTPAGGSYPGTQIVTITDALQNPTIIFTANAGSNSNASNGDTPSRNFYTNCATGHTGSGGTCAVTPTNSGIVSHGQRWCNASQVVSDGCNGFGTNVVTSSSSGVGVHQLDNGLGAGGNDSALSTSQSFGGTSSNACSTIPASVASGTQPGLTIPGYTAGTTEVISLTSQSSNFNTSYLGPTKWTGLWDAADHYVRYLCQRVSTTSGSGLHLEFDLNHNISTGIYFGPGLHYDWSTQKIYYCFQGCSSWKPITLNDGTDHTTFAFPANHDLGFEIKYHRTPGCLPSSGSNCEFVDKMCIQDLTASGANNCYTAKDSGTGLPVGGIPVNKSTWTRNEVTLQHQIDENGASITETATIAFDNVIGYATPTVTIYYTTDGSTPTTSSTVYSGPITVSSNTTLKAIAVAPGYSNSAVHTEVYVINGTTADPVITPGTGTYTTAQTVAITDSTPSSVIHYTTDASTPTSASPVYLSTFLVAATTTVKAIAITSGFADSNVVTAALTITGTVAAPTFTPAPGSYATTQNVTLATTTPGASIRYTTSGTAPTCSTGTVYTTPVAIISTATLKAIGCEAGWADSTVTSGLYTINGQVATPTFTPGAGTYTGTQTVTIASATSGATIYYTTDGTTPTTSSTVYSSPISVSLSETVKALAVKASFTNSNIGSAAYVINPPAPTINGIVAGLGHFSGKGSLK